MSTNFYMVNYSHKPAFCEHIGKRSAGWAFTFQGQNHKSFQAWVQRLTSMGEQEHIEDEYGNRIRFVDFIVDVVDTKRPRMERGVEVFPQVKPASTFGNRSWHDEGFSFSGYDFS